MLRITRVAEPSRLRVNPHHRADRFPNIHDDRTNRDACAWQPLAIDSSVGWGAGELVRQFECVGDTAGNEAGIRTGVRAHFNPITIEVETGADPKIKSIQVEPTPKFVPSHVAGDREFKGHGPRVEVSASISLQNQAEIWARVRMQAKETVADWTEATGSTNFLIYRHDRPIAQLMTPTFSSASYTDTNHDDDELALGASGLVERFICTGDTAGPEAGTKTGVVVRFNPITFREM